MARDHHSLNQSVVFTMEVSVLSYEPLYTSSHDLKNDYPWSGLAAKTPRLLKYLSSANSVHPTLIQDAAIYISLPFKSTDAI